jgi:hypothetical protein
MTKLQPQEKKASQPAIPWEMEPLQ